MMIVGAQKTFLYGLVLLLALTTRPTLQSPTGAVVSMTLTAFAGLLGTQ